jgi:Tol biopolymer transport system component
MTKRGWAVLTAWAVAWCAVTLGARQTSADPEVLLQAALHAEQIEGQLDRAIEIYKSVVAKAGTNRQLAASAWFHIGACYEKLSRPEAGAAYRTVVEDYGDAGDVVVGAKARLAALQGGSPSPFRFKVIDDYFKDAQQITLSPDGTKAAYVRSRPAPPAPGKDHPKIDMVYLRTLTSGTERLLFDANQPSFAIFNLVWSPDSEQVAGLVSDNNTRELRVMPASGAPGRVIDQAKSQISRVTWSPDGRRIAFLVGRANGEGSDLRVRALDATDSQSFRSSARTAMWSPDSKRIAFVPQEGAQPSAEIAIVSIDSGERRTVPVPGLPAGVRLELALWVRGDFIAFNELAATSNDLYLVPAAGGPVRRVSECRGNFGGDGCAAITPDGRDVILRKNESDGGRMVFRDLSTGADRTITYDSAVEQVGVLPIKNAQLLAFSSNRDGKWGVYVAPVDRFPVQKPVWLADATPTNTLSGQWTSDGLVMNIHSLTSSVYRVDLDPSAHPLSSPRRLSQEYPENLRPTLSPDGGEVAYVARTSDKFGVALMTSDGKNERFVTSLPPNQMPQQMAWQSAQALLSFQSPQASPAWLLNVTTGIRAAWTQPSWVGHGPTFVAARNEVWYWGKTPSPTTSQIRARSLATDAEQTFEIPALAVEFRVSPDGRSVVYTTVDDVDKPKAGDMRLRQLDHGSERVLAKFDTDVENEDYTPLAISPDGASLVYQDAQAKLRVMNLQTTESWPLLTNAPAGVNFSWAHVSWAPDRSFVIIDGTASRTEWRLYQGLTHDAVVKLIDRR